MSMQTLQERPYLMVAVAAATALTAGIALSLTWNLNNTRRTVEGAALTAARTAYEKDMVYRRWSSNHGGVYVPVSEIGIPNPYLEGLPGRDVTTLQGQQLTLINPSYMNRQVHEMERRRTGAWGHLTSLDPMRPENMPDRWERRALRRIVAGQEEYAGLETLDGTEYMRLMKPVVTERTCLKCHEAHGYKMGELRGGLSVSIPMGPFRDSATVLVRVIWFLHIVTWFVGMAGIFFSTTRLNDYYRSHERAEGKIRDSLEEKEVLLREIHHRVKNNLQVISGMLELQASLLADEEASASLRESRNRVMTMSLIHQRLYQSGDVARIAMDSYIRGLVADLFSSYGVDPRRIAMNVDTDPVDLGLDMAIPVGLIVNELVTNSIKYAYPFNRVGGKGTITVQLRKTGEKWITLTITDDGVGLSPGFDLEKASTLGLKMVHNMVDQMSGEIASSDPPGLTWTITCPIYQGAGGTRFMDVSVRKP